jgi:hypothetical protein
MTLTYVPQVWLAVTPLCKVICIEIGMFEDVRREHVADTDNRNIY